MQETRKGVLLFPLCFSLGEKLVYQVEGKNKVWIKIVDEVPM